MKSYFHLLYDMLISFLNLLKHYQIQLTNQHFIISKLYDNH